MAASKGSSERWLEASSWYPEPRPIYEDREIDEDMERNLVSMLE